jgi:uncharacterized MAPEG superfamily protein
MTTELRILLYATVLGLVHIMGAAMLATKQRGTKWNMSARDGKTPELTGLAGRMDRASKNFLETFPLVAAVILTLHAAQVSSSVTVLGAQIYFAARVLYIPLYAFGIPVVRTLVWTISIVGFVMLLAPLFGL